MDSMQQRRPETSRRSRGDAGVALVEFALVLPLLLTLMIGIVDFGRAFNYWIDQTHLAAETARWAVVNHNPGDPTNTGVGTPTLQQYIKAQADSAELRSSTNGASVCITFPNGATVSNPVQVTVKYRFGWLPWIQHVLGVGTTTIGTKATMRLEATPTHFDTSGNITTSGVCT
jgi:Flp pilus assembly protein TadG